MKSIGCVLIVLGTFGALFFFAAFDTSVAVSGTGERVNNIGLLNTRSLGVVISLFATLIGLVLWIVGFIFRRQGGITHPGQSMAERLDEIEQRKRAADKSGAGKPILEQLKQNVK